MKNNSYLAKSPFSFAIESETGIEKPKRACECIAQCVDCCQNQNGKEEKSMQEQKALLVRFMEAAKGNNELEMQRISEQAKEKGISIE